MHTFGPPTSFELLVHGRSYPPKAIVGLACRHQIGRALEPHEFSSGVAPGQAVHVLRHLGYTVVRMAEDWSGDEAEAIVADYFAMLRLELLGQPFNKSEHRHRLVPLLNDRSNGSVEFKHQNISAVLIEKGLPYVEGYKPRGNYQSLLSESVDAFLERHPGYFEPLAEGVKLNPRNAPTISDVAIDRLFVQPPEQLTVPHEQAKPWLSRRGLKLDFTRRDAENRRLGKLGEQWVVEVERRRLREAGRDDLSAKVEWVAQTCGDGLGFDVLSYDAVVEQECMIEVKTTGLGKFFPFLVTTNEVRCSEDLADRFHLYRVFAFSSQPRLYALPGPLSQSCRLRPALYHAYVSGGG